MNTPLKAHKNNLLNKIKAKIFKMLPSAILLLIICAGIAVAIMYKAPKEQADIIEPYAYEGGEEDVIVDNGELKLTMNPLTTQFSVEVKDSGKVWYSNPIGAAEDPQALEEQKAIMQSPLLMSWSITQGLETTYNAYSFSAKNGIYEITPMEDGIRVDYSLGSVEKEYVIPPVITEEEMKKWMGNLDKKDADLVVQYFKKYDINKLKKTDNKDELLASYPILSESVIYVFRDTAKENVRKQVQGLFEQAGYTYEAYLADKELDLSVKQSKNAVFNVSVIYRLEGNSLVVEIPLEDVKYDKSTPVYTITPLPYFGAGGTDTEGYMLVPEGGGGIINFNNGKTSQSSYYTNIYGWDMCLGREAVVHNTRAYYGVYGIAEGDDSFLCLLEDGSAYASITADVSGKGSSYNYVNAVYGVGKREKYKVGDIANSDIYEYMPSLPEGKLSQRYLFINSGDYTDMSKEYGKYLQEKYSGYMELLEDESTPVVIELVGAIDKVKQILGVPVSRPLKLTSYEEAGEILSELNKEGVSNIYAKLTGWSNGGVNQKVLSKVKPINMLGAKKELKALAGNADSMGVKLYLNGITQYAYDSNLADGFFSYRDAAKFVSKERAELFAYSRITYAQRENVYNNYFLLHTEVADKYANTLNKYAAGIGAGTAFQDLGMDLSSDYYRKKTYNRQEVLTLHAENLKNMADNGQPVMINMGNDYAVPYADMVTKVDLVGSRYTILDACVPFFQMAVHGRVNYTGDSINICGNPEDELLYSAEYGAGLAFTFMEEKAFATQKTLYSEYYGANFESWKQRMYDIYNRYNEELGHTFNQEMTGHKKLSDAVSLTEYADGTQVYVNYGYEDFVTAEGVTLPARDYLVKR